METNEYIIIYVYGWLTYSHALIKEFTVCDVLLSHIVGLLWPITFPARVIREIIK